MGESRNILFYDGECGICQRSVRFLMKRDRRRRLHFAPLQGETAEGIVPEAYRNQLSTLVYRRADGSLSLRSTGALRALIDAGGPWRLPARLALRLPRRFRDAAYDWVARNRGKLAIGGCRLPTPDERKRLLP
ncbi:MAG: thiol-disulfide oxidoreductase DCC family protein [Opitutales bacterium]